MTSLVFRNFYFDYYSYRFGLGFRLGFRLGFGLGLGLGFGLGLRVSFFSLYYKMSARTERAPSLFQKSIWQYCLKIINLLQLISLPLIVLNIFLWYQLH